MGRVKKASDNRPKIDLSDDFFGAVLNCAVRYCLGRASYMPSLVTGYIRPLLPYLSNKTLWCFANDIEKTEHYGMEQDERLWKNFLIDVKAAQAEREKND